MKPPLHTACALFAATAALAACTAAAADPGGAPSRVTIRGTGNHVVIERSPLAPASPAPAITAPVAVSGPIARAAELKKSGATDDQVFAFLLAHADELPSIIEAIDVKRLRAAGVGRDAIRRLATLAAVDIGESSSEPRPPEPAPPPVFAADELPPGAIYGYPGGVAYGAAYVPRAHVQGVFPRIVPRFFQPPPPVAAPAPTRRISSGIVAFGVRR